MTEIINQEKETPLNKELFTALAKAQGEIENAKKDTANAFFKSKYADLASVINAAKKPLADNGLSILQLTDTINDKLVLITQLSHSSGQFIRGYYPISIPLNATSQAVGSALTYARRYAYSAIIGIAQEDDDGNSASGKIEDTKPQPKPYVPEEIKAKPVYNNTYNKI